MGHALVKIISKKIRNCVCSKVKGNDIADGNKNPGNNVSLKQPSL